jgi:hypothetical protein
LRLRGDRFETDPFTRINSRGTDQRRKSLSVRRDRVGAGSEQNRTTLAADLVNRRPVAIVAPTGLSALAAKAATGTIPIIFRIDPVELEQVPA